MSRIPAMLVGRHFPSRLPRNPYAVDPLTAAFMQQDQMARDENERRYLDILSGRQGLRERVTGDLAGYGKSMIDDVNRRADLGYQNDISDLTSRGLGASTIRTSVRRANDRERNAELARVNDAIINRRVNADTQLSDSLYGFQERRNDVQPNPNTLMQLSQGLGQAGYGGMPFGGGYGTGYGNGGYGGGSFIAGGPTLGGFQLGMSGGATMPRPIGGGYTGPQRPGPYTAPQVSGGYDDQFGNALQRYNDRQQMQFAGGGGLGYGGGYSQMMGYGAGFMGRQPAQWRYNSPTPLISAPPPTSRPNATLNAQNAAADRRYNFNQQVGQAKFSQGINPGHMGFGHNVVNVMDSAQMPAQSVNLGYGNPVQQNNQLLAGAVQSAPSYSNIPTGYPLGRPRPKREPIRQALLQGAGAAMLPLAFNPYSAMLR